MTIELVIEGMSCEHCVGRVEKALAAVDGVTGVAVRLDPASATVDGRDMSLEALVEAVDRVGYTASLGT
jgi:copper chaperone CopZ